MQEQSYCIKSTVCLNTVFCPHSSSSSSHWETQQQSMNTTALSILRISATDTQRWFWKWCTAIPNSSHWEPWIFLIPLQWHPSWQPLLHLEKWIPQFNFMFSEDVLPFNFQNSLIIELPRMTSLESCIVRRQLHTMHTFIYLHSISPYLCFWS